MELTVKGEGREQATPLSKAVIVNAVRETVNAPEDFSVTLAETGTRTVVILSRLTQLPTALTGFTHRVTTRVPRRLPRLFPLPLLPPPTSLLLP